MFTIAEKPHSQNKAIIKIVGVGGGGCNTIDYMVEHQIEGVELFALNTDAQSLEQSILRQTSPESCLQIGKNITRGLGAGRIVQVGQEAAKEDIEHIRDMLSGADMVFIAAGLGGGTGSGAAPVVAEIARSNGSLTVAVVTKPFHVEGNIRMSIAEQAIEELSKNVDSLITIPNEKLLGVLDKEVLMADACTEVDKVLHNAVQGIAELITRRGQFNNLDFADVKTVMTGTGIARIGVGVSSSENRAYDAAHAAISNPLLEDIRLSNVKGILVNITAGQDFRLKEYQEIAECMKALVAEGEDMMIGQVVDDNLQNEVRVTLVATGFDNELQSESKPSEGFANQELDAYPTLHESLPVADQTSHVPSELEENVPSSDKIISIRAHRGFGNKIENNSSLNGDNEDKSKENNLGQEEYLDIPTFLRNQAD